MISASAATPAEAPPPGVHPVMLRLLHSCGQQVFWQLSATRTWLRARGATRALLVVDRTAVAAAGVAEELAELRDACEIAEFSAFSPNPRQEEGAAAARLAADCGAQAVLGVGGGSCLDVAKLAALAALTPDKIDALTSGADLHEAQPLPLLAAPTTSGTGSEATHFAAIYVAGRKVSVAHSGARPAAVVLDVRLHQAMPAQLAASTGLDALGQAMESLWSVGGTERSAALASAGGMLVAANLVNSCQAGAAEARTAVMVGAHLAGQAINISKTTAAHALSYQLTQRFGLSHGHAVALTLGHVAAENARTSEANCADPRGPAAVRERVQRACVLLGVAPDAAPRAVHALLEMLALPATLQGAGVPRAALPALAESVDSVRLGNNPRRFRSEDLADLLERAYCPPD